MPEFDGELHKSIRVSMGQQARLPDLQRLPRTGSDQPRIQASIRGRQDQVEREGLASGVMGRRRDEHREGRSSETQVARLLAQKLQKRLRPSLLQPFLPTAPPRIGGGLQFLQTRRPT